jgi:hypothetical protein
VGVGEGREKGKGESQHGVGTMVQRCGAGVDRKETVSEPFKSATKRSLSVATCGRSGGTKGGGSAGGKGSAPRRGAAGHAAVPHPARGGPVLRGLVVAVVHGRLAAAQRNLAGRGSQRQNRTERPFPPSLSPHFSHAPPYRANARGAWQLA